MAKITVILLIISAIPSSAYCQASTPDNSANNTKQHGNKNNSTVELRVEDKNAAEKINAELKIFRTLNTYNYVSRLNYNTFFKTASPNNEKNYSFDLIRTVNNNIQIGGFSDGNVNIVFNPQMYIQPADFISIYALHQKNVYVPFGDIKKNIPGIAMETAVMSLIETGTSSVFEGFPVLRGVTQFILKSGLNYIMNSFINSQKIQENIFDFYYFSASIRF